MGDLISYLKWRGDGTFAEHPYNEVDGLALAMLSYTRFTNIISPPYIDAEAIKKAKGTDAPEKIPEETKKLSEIEWYEEPIPDDSDFLVPDPDDVSTAELIDNAFREICEQTVDSIMSVTTLTAEDLPGYSSVKECDSGQANSDTSSDAEITSLQAAVAPSTDSTSVAHSAVAPDADTPSSALIAEAPGADIPSSEAFAGNSSQEDADAADVECSPTEVAADAQDADIPSAEPIAETQDADTPSAESVADAPDADTPSAELTADPAEADGSSPENPDDAPETAAQEPARPQTLREAAEKCLKEDTGFATPYPEPCRALLKEMGKSERFGNLILSDYVSIEDEEENLLFSALCIDLPDGTRYISYRGTGDEIEDWRQDFMISFRETPAQKMALNYLLNEILTTDKKLRIGGHSKGANLALYAAMMLPDAYRERVIEIYNADGPGICPEFRQEKGYSEALAVMRRFIPEFSVVGMLFEPPVPATIVASSGSGILQHNAFTWQIEGNTFIRKKELSPECIEYKKIFDEWIESADMEDRETFTEDFFDALRAGKAETLDDIAKSGLGGFGTILYSLVNVESQTKIVLGKLLKQVATHVRQLRPNDILTTRTGIAGISMLCLGFVFLILPDASYHIIGYTAAVGAISWLTWSIFSICGKEMPASERQAKVLFLLAPLLVVMFIACHPSFIPFVENIIVGILFLWLAEKFFRRSLSITETTAGKIIIILISVLFALLGVFSIAAPSKIYSGKSLTIGSFLMLMGMALVFSEMHRIVRSKNKDAS